MPKSKKVLVVVDMQNDFVDGVLGSQEAQAIVPKVAEKIKAAMANEDMIVCTLDTHKAELYPDSDEGKKIPIHCVPDVPDNNGWSLHPDIMNILGEQSDHRWIYVKKHVYGSIYLANRMRNIHPDHVEIVGLCTDICVISNAIVIRSVLPKASVVVDASCCAGSSPANHQMALQILKSCGIDVINEDSKE